MNDHPIYILLNDETVGPLTLQQIRAKLSAQEINSATLWVREGGSQWRPLFELQEIFQTNGPGGQEQEFPVGWVVAMASILILVAIMAAVIGPEFIGQICAPLLLLFVYFTPTFLVLRDSRPNAAAIIVLNVVAGWTFIGWVVALVWALTTPRR